MGGCLFAPLSGVLVMKVARDENQTGPATPEADRIVAGVLAGDTPAFAGLIRMYQESVWRIAASMLRDRDATESLVQQVFVDAYFHLDQYAPGTDFGAWVRTVARNRLRKELRSAGREDRRLAVYRERLAERLAPMPARRVTTRTRTSRRCASAARRFPLATPRS